MIKTGSGLLRTLILGLWLSALAGGAHADMVASCQQQTERAVAVAACTKVIESGDWQGRDMAWAYNNRGLAHAALGDALRALADYDKAIGLDPTYAPAFSNRGNIHAILGDLLPALADHERAIALDPGYVEALHNRAVDLEELGRHKDALAAYRKVIARDPAHRGAHIGLASASCKLGRIKASGEARLAAVNKGLIPATEMQVLLQGEGFYRGPIDGKFGKGSRAALRAWTRKGCLPVR